EAIDLAGSFLQPVRVEDRGIGPRVEVVLCLANKVFGPVWRSRERLKSHTKPRVRIDVDDRADGRTAVGFLGQGGRRQEREQGGRSALPIAVCGGHQHWLDITVDAAGHLAKIGELAGDASL